jgi:hypothetical protein
LNKLSPEEGRLLEVIFDQVQKRRQERHEKQLQNYERTKKNYLDRDHYNPYPKKPNEYAITSFNFDISRYSKENGLNIGEFYFKISNLITLGLLKWETDVRVEAQKADENPEDTNIDVYVYNDDEFVFTSVGEKFVRLCRGLL